MSDSYWHRTLEQRVSRRVAMVGGASLAGAAALLAACGGGSKSDGGGATGASKVFTNSEAETPVKMGGIFKKHITADPANLDLYRQTAAGPKDQFGGYSMNRLVGLAIGPGTKLYKAAPELAESWEIGNGGLTYTFKVRKGVKFHNIPPVSARIFDSEDVVASWKRFSVGVGDGALSGYKTGSPLFGGFDSVESVSAPDKDTVVFKVKKPNAAFLTTLAAIDNGFFIFPKEADITYDPTKTLIGTGPWILSEYVPTSRLEYKKNPEYWEKGLPYMDGAITYFIAEAAQRIAQFQAGSVFHYSPSFFEEFRDLSALPNVRILDSGQVGSTQGINFARLDPESPFLKDVRTRLALSLGIDRETILSELNDLEKYKSAGVERMFRHGTFVPGFLTEYWIDPFGPEMGTNAQWYAYDPQKAKQLLSAAGYPNGFEFPQRYASRNTGASLNVHAVLHDSWAQAGLRSVITPEDYDAIFNSRSWRGEASLGIAIHGPQAFPDPAQQIDFLFGPTGTRNAMRVNDAKLNEMQDRNLAELDFQKRRSIVIEEMQYLSGEMRHVPLSWNSVSSFTFYQPQVRNNQAYVDSESSTGPSGTNTTHWWLAS